MLEGLDLEQLPAAIEALLFVSDEPVSAMVLAKLFDENVEEIEEALLDLQRQIDGAGRGIQLREVAGGWRLYTHPTFHGIIEKYVLSWDTRKLSSAALETLAIVAYMQPVTRAQVSAVRGVTSDGPIATLVDRGYLREAGTLDAPGNPVLYATTSTFLEKYGLASVADLPDLEDFAPDDKTAQIIRERLGAPAPGPVGPDGEDGGPALPDERELPTAERLVADAQASLLGVVDKIDFDQLIFNTDDE